MRSAFDRAFAQVLGLDAVAQLIASFTDDPVILLAGDQASGKSTAARLLAERLGGKCVGTGALVRARATELGLTVEELSARLGDDPHADVRNDYLGATVIATGGAVVFESRLAGHIGAWLRGHGRRGLFSAYLRCAPGERALRVLERATSASARARIEGAIDETQTFGTIVGSLTHLVDPEVVAACGALRAAADRDEQDRARLRSLYGIDYADTSVFDTHVDTTATDPTATAELILARWRSARGGRS